MAKKKILNSPTLHLIANFLSTLSSAWFIAGIITPSTYSTTINSDTLIRGTMSLILSSFFLLFAIKITIGIKSK